MTTDRAPRTLIAGDAAEHRPVLSRRALLRGVSGGLASLTLARTAAADDGPEEIGLPQTSEDGVGGMGSHGGAGAGQQTSAQVTPSAATATPTPEPVTVNGVTYTAYIDTVIKQGQWQQYTCEFDIAYTILKTYGIETDLDELIGYVGIDDSIDPHAVQTPAGAVIYGGDIGKAFCGDLETNTYAKTRSTAMAKAFHALGCTTTSVSDRQGVERGLIEGHLMWMKCTVDFQDFIPTKWITPTGTSYPTVLDNDHCVAAIGFNDDVVVIRDCLGPTNTNWDRQYEYPVPWDTFMRCWSSSGYDAVLVAAP